MDRELWSQLSRGMFDVARTFRKSPRHTYSTHQIVRVHLWAVLHDRPVSWATQPRQLATSDAPAFLARSMHHESTVTA